MTMPASTIVTRGSTVRPERAAFLWPLGIALALCVALFAAHIGFGTVHVPLQVVVDVLLGRSRDAAAIDIVWTLRVPRALVCLTAGAMFGLAGAMLQSITRNALAEPGLMGVSGGAVLAIVTTMVVASRIEGAGLLRHVGASLTWAGIVGGMLAGSLTYAISRRQRSDPALLVLAGVLVAGATGSLTSLLLLVADEGQVRQILQWTVGSTNGRLWAHWHMLWPFALVGLTAGLASAGLANALQLGDDVARGLGLGVERVRFLLILIAAVLTAGAVSVVGAVGFIGLIGPHLARRVTGSDARRLFPGSVVASALLLAAADIVARTVSVGWLAAAFGLPLPARVGVPVGVITPLLGAPVFLYLVLVRDRARA